jgi:hypothetical protein
MRLIKADKDKLRYEGKTGNGWHIFICTECAGSLVADLEDVSDGTSNVVFHECSAGTAPFYYSVLHEVRDEQTVSFNGGAFHEEMDLISRIQKKLQKMPAD